MASSLQRITTDYVALEDRIRLTGRRQDGQIVVLWLPQRLLKRLLPRLLPLLAPSAMAGAGESARSPSARVQLQALAQSAARLERASVPAVPPDQATLTWLVHEVELRAELRRVILVWRGAQSEEATLEMDPLRLRQWLNMVFDCYRHADWPMTIWPRWMHEVGPGQATDSVLH
jgi:hypothetical protein